MYTVQRLFDHIFSQRYLSVWVPVTVWEFGRHWLSHKDTKCKCCVLYLSSLFEWTACKNFESSQNHRMYTIPHSCIRRLDWKSLYLGEALAASAPRGVLFLKLSCVPSGLNRITWSLCDLWLALALSDVHDWVAAWHVTFHMICHVRVVQRESAFPPK